MYIYTSEQVRAYVYICIHKVTGQIYAGYREKNIRLNLPSHLDFPLYRTSCPKVSESFDEYDWYIVAEFISGDDAFDFEQQLIFENWDNPLLLNEQYRLSNGKKRFKSNLKNKPKSDRHKANLSTAAKNRVPPTEQARENMSIAKRGKPPNNKGKPNKKRDAKALANMSACKQGEKHPFYGKTHNSVSCIYCHQEIKMTVFGRYHGIKCKLYKSE